MCCVETHVRSPPAGPYGQISLRTSCKPPKAFPKRLEPKIESRKGELNSPIRAEFFRRSREKQAVGFVSIPISVDTRATPNIPRETRRAMAQTSRSIAPGTKRAMRDVTNAVSPRDIAPKPRAKGKENNKDGIDTFHGGELPAAMTTPAPSSMPGKTYGPSPTSVMMGPGTPEEATPDRDVIEPPEASTPELVEMTSLATETSDDEAVATPLSPETPSDAAHGSSPGSSPFVPSVLEELLGAQLPRAATTGEPTVSARRTSENLPLTPVSTTQPPSKHNRVQSTTSSTPSPSETTRGWQSVPSPSHIVAMGRERQGMGSSSSVTPRRQSRMAPVPTFLDELTRKSRVVTEPKATNTDDSITHFVDQDAENLREECVRLKHEIDFHREVSKEVGVTLDAATGELIKKTERVEFLEALKDEWDAQFKELSADAERCRVEAETAREETLAVEALAAAARASATSAEAEAERLRSHGGAAADTGKASGSASGSAALFRRHVSGPENDVAASIAATLRERESELDALTRELEVKTSRAEALEAKVTSLDAKLAAKLGECAALRGECNTTTSALRAAESATSETEGALMTTLSDKKALSKELADEKKLGSEKLLEAVEAGRRSASRARANWGFVACVCVCVCAVVCAWAAFVPPAGWSLAIPLPSAMRETFGLGTDEVRAVLPGAGYSTAAELKTCRRQLADSDTIVFALSAEAERFATLVDDNDALLHEVEDLRRVSEDLRERSAEVAALESRLAHLEASANDAMATGDDPRAATVAARAETERLRHALAKERSLRRRSAFLESLDSLSIGAVLIAWVTCLLGGLFFARKEVGLRRAVTEYGELMETAVTEHAKLESDLAIASLESDEERVRRERAEVRMKELERQLDASRKVANEATKRVEAFEAIGRREREREREGARSTEKKFGKSNASLVGGAKNVTWDDDVSVNRYAPLQGHDASFVPGDVAQTPEAGARPHNTVFKPPTSGGAGAKSFQ